jgi:hypothetical protein
LDNNNRAERAVVLIGTPQAGRLIGYNASATLDTPLLPTCNEQPEGGLSSVAFLFLVAMEMSL